MTVKKTPLHEIHVQAGARMVDFHGWEMPVQYAGVVGEHRQVREHAGLFDVSHMGEILVFGSKATEYVNHLVTNDVASAEEGQCVYTPMCNEDGGVIDDLLVYKYNSGHYMLVVNAGNAEKDLEWIKSRVKDVADDVGKRACEPDDENHEAELCVRDVGENTALIALQGPESEAMLQKLTDYDLSGLNGFRFKEDITLAGDVKALVSRTGYTGEEGFEIYVNDEDAVDAWKAVAEAGAKPAGLGARDTLRLEAGLMLYGNDLTEYTTPMEAAISWTVKLGKKEFIGKDELLRQHADGVGKKMAGFELLEKGVPRKDYRIELDGDEVGYVTSGTMSPTLGKGIGLGYVKPEYAEAGIIFDVVIRDTAYKARVVEIPFYRR